MMAIRNLWKWLSFVVVLFLVFAVWYLYTQPMVTSVEVMLSGYEIVFAEELQISAPAADPPEPVDSKPCMLTLVGKINRYPFRTDLYDGFEGTILLDDFSIVTGDLNGIRSGGTLTAEEAWETFGEQFRFWESEHRFHHISIGNRHTIQYMRTEDGAVVDTLEHYRADDMDIVILYGWGDHQRYFVFPAETPEDAGYLWQEFFWRTYQQESVGTIPQITEE